MIVDDDEKMYYKLDLLLRMGQILVESSADTDRVLRTINRAADFLKLPKEKLHIFVNYNMLMVNVSDTKQSYTKFLRCENHGINFDVINDLSHLSVNALRKDYTVEHFEEELERIKRKKRNFTPWQVAIGAGFACGGFCVQFGCDWPAFFYASIAAILGFRAKDMLTEKGCNAYLAIGLSAMLATIIAWLTSFISLSTVIVPFIPSFAISSTPWHPLLACALFIVPGVPLINFVSDMINGYIQTGLVRALNTFVMLVAMAIGIMIAVQICGIDNFARDLSMVPHNSYFAYALAACISAIGFSMIYSTPIRLWPIVAMGGMVAVCTRNFVNLGPSTNDIGLDQGLVIGSLVGSTLISLIVVKIIRHVHVPHQCITIPSVIPMVPGVLMYRSLFALCSMHGVVGEVTVMMHNGIMASLVTLCIAIGVAIPNIFFKKLIKIK